MHQFVLPLAKLAAAVLLLQSVAACQSTCVGDPRIDDLGCATRAIGSGTYKKQTEDLRVEAEQQLAAAAVASRQAVASQQQAASAAQQRQAVEQRVADQEAEIARLRAALAEANQRLATARSQPQNNDAEIARLEAEVAALQLQIDSLLES